MCKQFHTWMCSLNQEYRERASALRLRKIFSTASVQYRFLDPDPCLADFQRGKFWGSLGSGVGSWLLRALPVEARSVFAPPHPRPFSRRWFASPARPRQRSAPFAAMLPGAAGMRREPRRDGLPEGQRGTRRPAEKPCEARASPVRPCPQQGGGSAPFRSSPRPRAVQPGGGRAVAEPALAARRRQVWRWRGELPLLHP